MLINKFLTSNVLTNRFHFYTITYVVRFTKYLSGIPRIKWTWNNVKILEDIVDRVIKQ